jgi:hypothetical protein
MLVCKLKITHMGVNSLQPSKNMELALYIFCWGEKAYLSVHTRPILDNNCQTFDFGHIFPATKIVTSDQQSR